MEGVDRLNHPQSFKRATKQAYRILHDWATSQDVAAEALARITEGRAPSRALGVIVHRLAIDELRRREVVVPVGLAQQVLELAVAQAPAPETYERAKFRRDFDAAMRDLEPEDRDALILTDLRGLTEREAAGVLGASQPTVHRRADSARHTVRREIA